MKRLFGGIRGRVTALAVWGALVAAWLGVGAPGLAGGVSLDYMIIVTGGELLRGVYADGHTHHLTRTLGPWGGRCLGSLSIDDRAADLLAALEFASPKAPLVIVTGGLGPTDDDITRQTLSEFTGIALREDPDLIRALAGRFGSPGGALPANVRRQALVPARGGALPNRLGTAAGLIFEAEPAVIVALPGPPRELQFMVREFLIPWLVERYGLRAPGSSITCRFVGIGESRLDQVFKGMIPLPPEVTLSSLFDGGRVDVTFMVPAEVADGPARLRRVQEQVRQHLGEYLYSDDGQSLEQVVAGRLREGGHTLALVEIGTDGDVAAALGDTAEMKAFLKGAYVAPTEPAMAVLLGIAPAPEGTARMSAERLTELTDAAMLRTGCRCVVGLGERHAAGDGQSLWVVVRGPRIPSEQTRLAWRGSDRESRGRLVTQILDLLRRSLSAGPAAGVTRP